MTLSAVGGSLSVVGGSSPSLGGAAATVVSTTLSNSTTDNPAVITAPAGITAGQTLLVLKTLTQEIGGSHVESAPAGWTKVAEQLGQQSGDGLNTVAWSKVADGSEGGTDLSFDQSAVSSTVDSVAVLWVIDEEVTFVSAGASGLNQAETTVASIGSGSGPFMVVGGSANPAHMIDGPGGADLPDVAGSALFAQTDEDGPWTLKVTGAFASTADTAVLAVGCVL